VGVDVGVVEGGLPEQPERLLAGEHRREFAAEEFVDDEARVVPLDVERPQETDQRRHVDREVAVGEHLVDGRDVLRAGYRVHLGVEGRAEVGADAVDERDHHVLAAPDPLPLVADGRRCELHTASETRGGLILGAGEPARRTGPRTLPQLARGGAMTRLRRLL